MNCAIIDDMGFLRTKKQFVIIIKDKIYGPFKNEDYNKILDVFKDDLTEENSYDKQ